MNRIKNLWDKFYRLVFIESLYGESLWQWIIRSFLLPSGTKDSPPSWTYTLVVYFAILFGCLIFQDISLSVVPLKEFDPTTGNLIRESVRGVSVGCWGLASILAGALVFFIKFRDQRYKNNQGEIIEKAIEIPEPTEDDKKSDTNIIDTITDIIK